MPGAIIKARILVAAGRPTARLLLADLLSGHGNRLASVHHTAVAARRGLPEAQTRLGISYLRGIGVPPSQSEARHWLERAAKGGDAEALTELAALALRGVWGPYHRGLFADAAPAGEPNPGLAARLARHAVLAGSAEAKALLAYILYSDPTIPRTPGEPEALYREASEAGRPLGQVGHAVHLLGRGLPEAAREAHGLLTAAAKTGMPTAHFLLGAMAEAGVPEGESPDTAMTHFRIAAQLGHTGAKSRLGIGLLEGRGGSPNPEEAETWLRRAANENDVAAAAVLGHFLASSQWQPSRPREAVQWYRRAAELGHPASARVLAAAISAGLEGVPDPREIAAWLEIAIERGDLTAWPQLGGLITSASLPRDHLPDLHQWLQRMMRQEKPDAGYYVGVCVNGGIGTPVNATLARLYYLWAAGEGVVDAVVAAGEMLLNGRGGAASPKLARDLFEYASDRGHSGGSFALGIMASADPYAAMGYFRRAADLGHAKAKQLVAASTGGVMQPAVM